MKGHAAKKGKKWYAVIDEGRADNGRRQQRWHSGFRTRKEAEAAINALLTDLQRGTYVPPAKTTLGDYLRTWLDAHRVNKPLRDSTYHGYEKNIAKHVVPKLGHLTLHQLTPPRLDAFYAELLRDGRRDGKGGLNPRTVRHIHTMLHGALGAAVRKGQLVTNPADRADAPKATRATTHTWKPAELRAFLESVTDDRLYAAWLLSASTGLRRGELLGLTWRACDLDAGRISITQTILDIGHKVTLSTPKTDKGRRTVALDQATILALREHRKRQMAEISAMGDWPDHGLVFTREDGAAVHPAWFSRAFAQRVRRAGLPAIRLHDLRHTHATIALEAGVHPKIVSERLGHSTVALTLDVYSHAVPALEQEAAERVAALVSGATG